MQSDIPESDRFSQTERESINLICTENALCFAIGRRQILFLLRKYQGTYESVIFRKFLKFIKIFGLKKKFSRIFHLEGSGPFVRSFSKIWQMVFAWSMFKFSLQKLNLQVIYCFFCFKYNNDRLRIHNCINVNNSK